MAAASRVELLEVLARGQFDEILGTAEGQQIEFKEHAYNLASPKGGRDLVADVAAFANARGGVVVLGIRTSSDPTSQQELASVVRGINTSSVDDDAYDKRIREHVHPLVRDVDIRHYDGSSEARPAHLVAIVVEAQADHDRPFVVDRVAADGEERDVAHALGWPTRAGDDTHWERAGRLQQLISNGLRAAHGSAPSAATTAPYVEADAQLAIVDELDGWAGWATYSVQVIGADAAPIDDFFGIFRDEARAWRGRRSHGFNLGLEWSPLESAGNRLVSSNQRTMVAVGRSGEITAAACTSPDFLGWAQRASGTSEGSDHLLVNPYVLVEFTTEALRFAYEFVGPRIRPSAWRIRVQWNHLLDRVPVELRESLGNGPPFPDEVKRAATASLSTEMDGTNDAKRDAFEILAEVYGQGFGLGRDTVPFAAGGRIDLDLMA